MKLDFGRRLSHFVHSLDKVSAAIDDDVRRVVHRLVVEKLGFHFYEVQTDENVRTDNLLITRDGWTNGIRDYTVLTADGEYRGQTTFAYDQALKLWITAADRGILEGARDRGTDYVNRWDQPRDTMPAYWDFQNSKRTRTSIIIPLRNSGRTFGFLNLEHPEALEGTAHTKREFESLADAVATTISKREATLHSDQRNLSNLREIEENHQALTAVSLERSTVFLGSSTQADAKVMGIILDVLRREFGERLRTAYWKDFKGSGEINKHILEAISTSTIGIVYLSESDPALPGRFRDNPNAVFEAGILQGLCSEPGGITRAWFAIREHDGITTPLFFNIATEHVLLVPRPGGQLNDDALRSELRERISALIKND